MQLALDFTPRPPLPGPLTGSRPNWLDTTLTARGAGFDTRVEISPALSDALEPISIEEDGDYDQRLYDALWLAHFELSLAKTESINFTFTFPRKHWKTEEITEASLRLRCESKNNSVFLGLAQDF